MKKGDRVDLVLTADGDGKPAIKVGDGPEMTLCHPSETPPAEEAVVLKATPCFSQPGRLHAEVLHAPEEPASPARSGPARYNSAKFRSGWDEIFGKQQPNKGLPN